jgi:E3 ubiquitin-protein ligase HUWE1
VNSFPIAHTCFNRLELPKYTNEEIMRKYLRSIVLNDLEGVFGMEWNNYNW